MTRKRTGIWLIGAKGGVATTTIVGLCALKRAAAGEIPSAASPRAAQPGTTTSQSASQSAPHEVPQFAPQQTPQSAPAKSAAHQAGALPPPVAGLVSTLPQFAGLGLVEWPDLVVGGHEIRRVPLAEAAWTLVSESRTVTPEMFEACRAQLDQIDRRIRPGALFGCGPTIAALADWQLPDDQSPRAAVDRLRADMTQFAAAEGLEHVVVVNLASTEPPWKEPVPPRWAEIERLLEQPRGCPLPASSLYAAAALESGFSYINFTPSLGAGAAAFDQLARQRHARHYGCDGKTGETLLKSVLAGMFAARNLHVLSWVGYNIFGNLDAHVLDDPANKEAKLASKDHLLAKVLGYRPETRVAIERVESLGDWKTAWDHVHFAGFLGTRMVLQFIWQGCDSALAAPLVLDLVRFTHLAWRRGHVGQMPFLASFFKSPYGVSEHRFERQFQMLEQWAAEVGPAEQAQPAHTAQGPSPPARPAQGPFPAACPAQGPFPAARRAAGTSPPAAAGDD